ncbi:hypothetical protein Tco_1547545 [Tanacetum coccineum]
MRRILEEDHALISAEMEMIDEEECRWKEDIDFVDSTVVAFLPASDSTDSNYFIHTQPFPKTPSPPPSPKYSSSTICPTRMRIHVSCLPLGIEASETLYVCCKGRPFINLSHTVDDAPDFLDVRYLGRVRLWNQRMSGDGLVGGLDGPVRPGIFYGVSEDTCFTWFLALVTTVVEQRCIDFMDYRPADPPETSSV